MNPPHDADRPSGLDFRLLWAASLFVPFAIFAAAALWSWRAIDSEARARLSRTADMLHEHALRSFETQEATLEAIDGRIRGMSVAEIAASREVHEFLARLVDRTAPSGGAVVIAPDGRFAAISWEFPARPVDVSDRDYFRRHREGDVGTYVGEVVMSRPRNERVFSISRRRSGGEGFDGIVASSFKPGYFEDFYRSVSESPRDVVALLRDDGAFLARSPPFADAGEYNARRGTPALDRIRQSERLIVEERSPIDNERRLYAFRCVGGYPVYVLYALSTSVMRDAWLTRLAPYATVCLLAALLLLLLTAQTQRAAGRERAALAAARFEAERRAEAEERLRHSQRVDALGQIVGGVAHDFNNIVMAVLGGTRMTRRRADSKAEVLRIADLVEAAAERGARLTQRMLAFARREDARTEMVEIGPALDAITELLGHTLGSGYRVQMQRSGELPPARGDRSEFETVLVNLVLNARDAMPDGGLVTVTAREEIVAVAGPTHAPGLQPGRYVRVAVTDNGTGMDAETLARAGEAFFTTKPPGKGTGLGLAMARGFAEQAGGALRIDSEPGRGTTVTLWMSTTPLSAEGEDTES